MKNNQLEEVTLNIIALLFGLQLESQGDCGHHYFKDFDSLVPNEEIKPEGLFFALISSSNSGHSTSIIREGKVFYVGMKGESALLRWENVTFNVLPFPNVEGDTGKYVISGTMECPVYETREEWNKAFYESLGITDITSFDTNQ